MLRLLYKISKIISFGLDNMQAYIGITDRDWFDFLRSRPQLDEVNFWQPSGNRQFRALNPDELFLFKLHAPYNSIVGGGFFAYFSVEKARVVSERY
jgi:putative restriction endonuclease